MEGIRMEKDSLMEIRQSLLFTIISITSINITKTLNYKVQTSLFENCRKKSLLGRRSCLERLQRYLLESKPAEYFVKSCMNLFSTDVPWYL